MPGWWTTHAVPRITDAACGRAEFAGHRARVCAGLRGRVLEIGFGSGHNLPHHPTGRDGVQQVVAVEPSDLAWRLSEPRRRATTVPVERAGLDGQRLAEPDTSYDAVLVTFSLCTIPDPALALAEVRRVLRPDGRLHLLEHGLAPDPQVVRRQRRLEPLQRRLLGGCRLTRDPVALVDAAGFEVESLEQGYLPGPSSQRPSGYLTGLVARLG